MQEDRQMHPNILQKWTRRFLRYAAIAMAMALSNQAHAGDTIKICVIDDLSGDFAIYGIPKSLGPQLAVKELNEAGGVLGKQLEIVFYDGQSDVKRHQELALKCVLDDQVDVMMAGTTSSEREVLNVTEN